MKILILSIVIIFNFTGPLAHAFPGRGSDDLDFNPAADSEGAQCLNLFGVDLNALYNVSEPFVNRNCHEIGTGKFYITNNHIIVNPEYSEDLRAQLEAIDYHFIGSTPMEDLLAKMISQRLVVTNEATGKARSYIYPASGIANTWDYINNDPLVCEDFFPGCEQIVGVPGSSPMVAFVPKLPPLPPGSYLIDMYFTFSELYNDGFSMDEFSFFPPGELLVFENFFEVVKRN